MALLDGGQLCGGKDMALSDCVSLTGRIWLDLSENQTEIKFLAALLKVYFATWSCLWPGPPEAMGKS